MLRAELDRLRDVVPELEAHLESLQNRYAKVTAENARLLGALESIAVMESDPGYLCADVATAVLAEIDDG